MSAKKEMQELETAKASGDTVTLDKLSRSEYKTVRAEAQKVLNEIDGLVDDGKDVSTPLDREERQPERVSDNSGWVDATDKELRKYQAEGRIVGHNPATGQVKLN